jgi:hypothetical protein
LFILLSTLRFTSRKIREDSDFPHKLLRPSLQVLVSFGFE